MNLRTGLLAVLAALLAGGVSRSDATFTSSSTHAPSTVSSGDWTPPVVTLGDPGSPLSGTVTLSASATDSPSGVDRIVLAVAPAGSGVWTTLCTVTGSPATCAFDTTGVADGLYDLRAMAVDAAGNPSEATVVDRLVTNGEAGRFDVQASNVAGGTAGTLEVGDAFHLTYGAVMNPVSILPGWSGDGVAVTVRLSDGLQLGGGNIDDTLEVFTSAALTTPVEVGSVNLGADVVGGNKTAFFDATMTLGAAVVNGETVSVVTVVLGAQTNSKVRTSPGTPANMVWTPSAKAVDLAGNAASAAPVTERGSLDVDF